jgi:hypothetical protein
MAQKSNLKRNIGIAVGSIIVIFVAVIGAIYLMGGGITISVEPPLDFQMSISSSSGTVLQGESQSISVYVTYVSGKYDNVALSGNVGSSGIQCSFDPATSTPDFTSKLTMSVPSSTPTEVYSIVVTAQSSNVTRTAAYTMSVLSAQVVVTGKVTTVGLGTHPTQIQFVDSQTGVTYTGSMSEDGAYYITLQNQHSYNVVCYWSGLLGISGTFEGGSLYVNAPVGYTTMSKDFSG